MEAIGVFSSCETALMNASCCSLRRISRTRKIVLRMRPAMMTPKKMTPSTSRATLRQLSRIQLTFSVKASPTRHAPSVMKNAMDLRWPLSLMRLDRHVTLSRSPEHPLKTFAARARALAVGVDEPDRFRQSEQFERSYAAPVDVNLVPGEAVACGARVRVVVVVPALAERHQGDEQVVRRVVRGLEPARPPDVRRRVDQPSRVQSDDRAQEDAPEEDRPAAEDEERDPEQDEREEVPARNPDVEATLEQVGRVALDGCAFVLLRRPLQNPADVRPPRPVARAVRVGGRVRMRVVNPVRRDPLDGPAFERQRGAERQEILDPLRRLVAVVRQQPVVAHAYAEAPGHPEYDERDDERRPREHEERGQRARVEYDHCDEGLPVDSSRPASVYRFCFHVSHFSDFVSRMTLDVSDLLHPSRRRAGAL